MMTKTLLVALIATLIGNLPCAQAQILVNGENTTTPVCIDWDGYEDDFGGYTELYFETTYKNLRIFVKADREARTGWYAVLNEENYVFQTGFVSVSGTVVTLDGAAPDCGKVKVPQFVTLPANKPIFDFFAGATQVFVWVFGDGKSGRYAAVDKRNYNVAFGVLTVKDGVAYFGEPEECNIRTFDLPKTLVIEDGTPQFLIVSTLGETLMYSRETRNDGERRRTYKDSANKLSLEYAPPSDPEGTLFSFFAVGKEGEQTASISLAVGERKVLKFSSGVTYYVTRLKAEP